MDTSTTPDRADQLLRDYLREDRHTEWLLRGIAAAALGLALLTLATLLAG